jgi:Asp-tRNA(Asn)/Glu-tRNA(Gln) amidotransferase A subunit family amidase
MRSTLISKEIYIFFKIFYRKLRIGYFTNDDMYDAHPGCIRAVDKARDLLESSGHSVIKVKVKKICIQIVVS